MAEREIKQMPRDKRAEQSVLGAMLLAQDAVDIALAELSGQEFYSEHHQRIFEAVSFLADKGHTVDTISVSDKLKADGVLADVGGSAYLVEMSESMPTAGMVKEHAKIVKDKYALRMLIERMAEILKSAYAERTNAQDLLQQAEETVFSLIDRRTKSDFETLGEVLPSVFNRLDYVHKKSGELVGLPTGFVKLDNMLSGLHGGELVIVAGRPGMGKTAFAMSVAMKVAQQFPVAVFSLEMTKAALAQRILTSTAMVDAHKARSGRLSKDDFRKISIAASDSHELPVYIDDTMFMTTSVLRAKSRRIQKTKGIKLLVIDYLQLLRSTRHTDSREREVADITRSLKGLSKELDIPVVLVCQLSRKVESRSDKKPLLSDLRESGAIEQDADVVLFLYRRDYYRKNKQDCDGEADVIVAKQRNGPTGTVPLTWLADYTRFEDRAYTDEMPF